MQPPVRELPLAPARRLRTPGRVRMGSPRALSRFLAAEEKPQVRPRGIQKFWFQVLGL
jgi:hypothetical protein